MRRVVGAWVVLGMIVVWRLVDPWSPASTREHMAPPHTTPPQNFLPATSSPVRGGAPVVSPAGPPPHSRRKAPPSDFTRHPLAFLSRAPSDSLQLLPGVGPTLARRIEQARRARGAFHSWSDLRRVKGIGDGTVARWRDASAGK
ncbi:MAG TPA: helix-hairpin-helix domain-containing protein [Candidatus Krumholzibacteria bacterium]|nr:helix-hairpin-helix domain-containing protein [Candidatus Krumholzibacteria bacterium]